MNKINTSFYNKEEIAALGFLEVGEDVLISRFARFYDINNITIGNHVRIDDFCILSGNITIRNYIHISAYCALYGSNGITLNNFSGLSPRVTILSASDDFSGDFLIGPTVAKEFRNVKGGPVDVGKFSQIGANSIVFPNLTIGDGVSIGALSLVNKSLDPWGIYAGVPARFIKERNKKLLELENILLKIK